MFTEVLAGDVQCPADWFLATATLIPKVPQWSRVQQLRPSAVLPTLQKAFVRILRSRISEQLSQSDPWGHGFRKGFQAAEVVMVLMLVIQKCREWLMEMSIVRIDLMKAYDMLSLRAVWDTMRSRGVPALERARCMQLLLYRRLRFRLQRISSDEIQPAQGLPQGCPIAPELFAAVVEDTLRPAVAGWMAAGFGFPTSEGTMPLISYADDIFLFGKNKHEVDTMMRECSESLKELGLHMQMAKGEYMVVCGPSDDIPSSLPELTKVTMMCVLGMWVSAVDLVEEVLERVIGRAWCVFHSVRTQLMQKEVCTSVSAFVCLNQWSAECCATPREF